jgi:hypothetical protein
MIDAQVETIPDMKRFRDDVRGLYIVFVKNVLFLLFFAMLALPGYCINFPIVAIAKLVAIRGARTALAGSTVKVAGRDVMASYKIITLMVVGPLMYTTIFLVNWYRFSLTYAILLCASLMLATYTSLYAMPETIMRIKSIAPFFLWISFKRYRRMFAALYEQRRDLEREVRQITGELGPTLGPKIWNERTQYLYELIKEEELKRQQTDIEQRSAKKLSIPFQAKHRSRLRPPRARDKILFYLNKVLHLNINWDYLAFPELNTSLSGTSFEKLDSFDDLVSLGTGLGTPTAWVKVEGEENTPVSSCKGSWPPSPTTDSPRLIQSPSPGQSPMTPDDTKTFKTQAKLKEIEREAEVQKADSDTVSCGTAEAPQVTVTTGSMPLPEDEEPNTCCNQVSHAEVPQVRAVEELATA